jgi:hypothetical protein
MLNFGEKEQRKWRRNAMERATGRQEKMRKSVGKVFLIFKIIIFYFLY